MARYQYAGPGPVPDPESGEIIRPGDVRQFTEEPAYGPWELLDGPGPSEALAAASAAAMDQMAAEIKAAQPVVAAAVVTALTPKEL